MWSYELNMGNVLPYKFNEINSIPIIYGFTQKNNDAGKHALELSVFFAEIHFLTTKFQGSTAF